VTDTRPFISVIAPTYNRSEVVERTLEHLIAQDYPKDRYEVILVDNSSDDTPQMAERVAATAPMPVSLIWVDERLPAVKRNIGLDCAQGDLVMFINDDVWFDPRALSAHAASHAATPGPAAVAGHVYQSPRMPWTPFTEAYQPFAYHEIADRADALVPYRYFWSMNLSLPRQVMLDRNLRFHEDWAQIGHEDIELGYRWSRAGLPIVYNPRATGEHYHPHTLDSACRLQASVGAGLRDLEKLVPERDLLERYGVLAWHNSPRAFTRGAVRQALFNRRTVPPVKRWLEARERNTRLSRWLYWKVLLHYTNTAYRSSPERSPAAVPTLPSTARSHGLAAWTPS
jgi:glycosyltransferase involved in cell wall biosynthesis